MCCGPSSRPASVPSPTPAVKAESFQHWRLVVDLDKRKGELTCNDGNGKIVFSEKLDYTDFPLPEICFYFTDNTILLPSEY